MQTITVDISEFKASLYGLKKGMEVHLLPGLKRIAHWILQKCIEAPIPFDTGALSRSGRVVTTGPNMVDFYFDKFYAAWMDYGNARLRPKPYGSQVGPNFYFTETIRRNRPAIRQMVIDLIEAELARAAKRRRR